MTKRVRQSSNECSRKKGKQEPVGSDVATEIPTPPDYSDPDSGLGEDVNVDTHPRSFDHHHVERLQEFTNDLHQALQSSFPSRTCPYTAVHVLLLRWEEDDLGVHYEISKLKRVFEDQFRFQAEEWNIPTSDPYHSLQDKIYHFQKSHQDSSELLIVYYGGHSDPDTRRGRSIWHANCTATTPSLEWFNIQPILLTAKPHVLMILDCCYAANAARDTTESSSKELLAACGRENQTPSVGIRSFTTVLIEELQSFEGAAFTVAMLHARLITLRHKLGYTPIYAALAEKGGNSIVISPLSRDPSSSPLGLGDSTGPGFNTDTASVTSVHEQLNTANDTPTALPTEVSLAESTRVLLAVSVAEDVAHNVAQWVSWLTTAVPWDVSKVDVRLECMYKSHSTLLLISVPIVGWSRLPESAAYRFIGFIKSGNLISEKTKLRAVAEADVRHIPDKTSASEASTNTSTHRETHTTTQHRIPDLPSTRTLVSSRASGQDRHTSVSWTPEKDELLIRARQEGMDWQLIATRYFPGTKTANACRKRHERLMEARNQDDYMESVKTDNLAKAYIDVREELWKPLAERVGEKWQTIEAKCMEKGHKPFQTIAQKSSSRPTFLNPKTGLDNAEAIAPTLSSPDETGWYDSGIGVEEGDHSAREVPFQPQLLPAYLYTIHPSDRPTFDEMAATTHRGTESETSAPDSGRQHLDYSASPISPRLLVSQQAQGLRPDHESVGNLQADSRSEVYGLSTNARKPDQFLKAR